jgi:hypothetical protein
MSAYAKKKKAQTMKREEIYREFDELKRAVKDATPIDKAIMDLTGARLRATGRTLEGLCPFHVEKTPSFKVDPVRGTYKCWGCGECGDIYSLVSTTQNLGFQQAVLFAADRIGYTVSKEIRDMVERKPATGKGKRKQLVQYKSSQVRSAPEDLAPSELIKVPDNIRRPKAKREFRIWNNRGSRGDRDPMEKRYFPEMVHEYRNVDNELLMSILRIRGRDKKFFIPARLMVPTPDCPEYLMEKMEHNGKRVAWVSVGTSVGEANPIYGMQDMRQWLADGGHNVLIVEGEKTRDAANRLLSKVTSSSKWLVLTPMGGSKSSIYADWGPFFDLIGDRKINIVQWPDADKLLHRRDGSVEDRVKIAVQQMQSVVAQRAIDTGKADQIILGHVKPPEDVESGWDLADAEEENWSPDDVMKYIRTHSCRTKLEDLKLRITDDAEQAAGAEVPGSSGPFDLADSDIGDDEADWFEVIGEQEMVQEMQDDGMDFENFDETLTTLGDAMKNASVSAVNPARDQDAGPEADDHVDAAQADDMTEEYLSPDDLDELDYEEEHHFGYPHFRCLGYLDNSNFFLSLTSGQIFELTPNQMKSTHFLHLAPLDWWTEEYGYPSDKKGNIAINWNTAIDHLIQETYKVGVWDPQRRCYQGARLDGGVVTFHTGSVLYVDGTGSQPLAEFNGKYVYAVGPKARMPDVVTPFQADSPELKDFLDIICRLDWRKEGRELSIMALFGWTAISPICGVLDWRPHIWLDGPRGSGKSWIVHNLVNKVLGDYVVNVLSNSSESGVRNLLEGRSVPVVFDEAEGEDRQSQQRMDGIIKMARHSAMRTNGVVAQGVAGGGASRRHSIDSTFMMTSIVPQLEAAADQSRFARIKLSSGRKHEGFKNEIEDPAMELITQEFSDRWIGRMLIRAKDYNETYRHMVHGLSMIGLERRLADVFGSFATGCWLMLCDGVPANARDAASFIAERFDVIDQLTDFNDEVVEDKDHNRLFSILQSAEVRLDGRNNSGATSVHLGSIMSIACGYPDNTDLMMGPEEAREILLRFGIRPARDGELIEGDELANTLLIHKKSPQIRKILEDTPYARSYADVMHQGDGVRTGKTVRFGSGMSPSRTIIVPLKNFSIGDDNE